MKTSRFVLPAMLLGLTLGLGACSKDDDKTTTGTGTSRMEVRLTDAPGDYKEVNIDIRSVQVHKDASDNGTTGWVTLDNIKPGIYNLLDFSNGKDTLLAASNLPVGHISQIRLVLGNDNSLVLKDGTTKALKTPSGQTSGLKVQIHADLKEDVTYVVLLDFDAAKSIVARGNGEYNLKPVIRAITQAVGGGIKGTVTPAEAGNEIHAIETAPGANAKIDTFGGFTNSNGAYMIKGLTGGTYKVDFYAPNKKKTVNTVVVTNDKLTTLDMKMD
ncbi:DUF4382 domain-containing protein [Adhaeribacter soli]|uniref:DUF4382 domain-containing protein n=1 Tax=Adhaeribacter soli TaxID=2607655 RepID=A0A5N1J5Q1_9BACT|nr:DUF4382 domain-containing protein [Adhaeribacter soli]KAA9340022.1 DUF4382 domain-containing protein [Adhaeribacter soli]